MARTIESPGVEINEIDLSTNATLPAGTKVLVQGFADQGPTNELVYITSKDELESVYFGGTGPKNAAERYFYHTCSEVLNSPATLMTTRFPYGTGNGDGLDGAFTLMAYPLASSASGFALGTPSTVAITQDQYDTIKQGGVDWSEVSTSTAFLSIADFDEIGNAGLIIVNDAQMSVNENYEGYYVALGENSLMAQAVTGEYTSVETMSAVGSDGTWTALTTANIGFSFPSISQSVESGFGFDFGLSDYDHALSLNLFRVRRLATSSDPTKLYFIPIEKYVGSLDETETQVNTRNGQVDSFSLETIVNNSSKYMKVFVNPNVKAVATASTPIDTVPSSLVSLGSYKPCRGPSEAKYIGDVPQKIDRALALVDSILDLDIDIVLDGGLSTIWAYVDATDAAEGGAMFDEVQSVTDEIADLCDPSTGNTSAIQQAHRTVFDLFNTFCSTTRKDCLHISDPLRGIFVQGADVKTMSLKSKNFSQHVYTPIRNLYSGANSNYACSYGNWVRKYDSTSSKYVWLPMSGFQAAIMARTDATFQPWWPSFGLNNGIIQNITDIAVRPNQKQCDLFYRIGVNPVVFFQGDGFVVWGQKTLQAKPSAFDRINVRRLFLTLERATMKVMRYFVGEPNTVFTRTRVGNILRPIFEVAKNNEGVYDYMIVCDERNNTAAVIDNNEMKVDIYLKPVRTAEYILVTFYATRTDQDFAELIG